MELNTFFFLKVVLSFHIHTLEKTFQFSSQFFLIPQSYFCDINKKFLLRRKNPPLATPDFKSLKTMMKAFEIKEQAMKLLLLPLYSSNKSIKHPEQSLFNFLKQIALFEK